MIPIFIFFILIQPKFSLANCTRHHRSASDADENWKFLNDPQCGLTNSDRIIGGEIAALGAYPWLALLGYKEKGDIRFRCGGSIISKKYIITAAHCLKNKGETLKVIRLGEHNLNTNPDCEEGHLFCNDPYKEYAVAQIIHHPKYDTPVLQNDIGLVKVDREIQFTEYIKPICIPKGNLARKNLIQLPAEVAGWGIYNIENPKQSPYLRTVKLPIIDMSMCENYRKRKIPLSPMQMCVGGRVGKDSCGGDSGGPLMRVDQDDELPGPRYYLLGIVSFGAARCGATDLPAIYTRLTSYLPWILENILH